MSLMYVCFSYNVSYRIFQGSTLHCCSWYSADKNLEFQDIHNIPIHVFRHVHVGMSSFHMDCVKSPSLHISYLHSRGESVLNEKCGRKVSATESFLGPSMKFSGIFTDEFQYNLMFTMQKGLHFPKSMGFLTGREIYWTWLPSEKKFTKPLFSKYCIDRVSCWCLNDGEHTRLIMQIHAYFLKKPSTVHQPLCQ